MEIGFLIALSFCLLILLLLLRWSTIIWQAKALLTVSALPVAWLFYHSLIDRLGWPVALPSDETMMIVSSDVREPSDTSRGVIYLWVVDVDGAIRDHTAGPPRAIRIPYTEQDHKRLAEAGTRKAAGVPSFMRMKMNQPRLTQGDNANQDSNGWLNFVPPPRITPEKSAPP